jgi:hypothetical protein
LQPGLQVLVSLEKDFQQILFNPEFRIFVFCFYEEYTVSSIGKIVSDESAIMEQYEYTSISGDHLGIIKFRSRTNSGYISVLRLLQSWIQAITTEQEIISRGKHQVVSKKRGNKRV